ncbi:MAG TPA: hypothetical protein VFP25_04475, partial [Nitrososphaeraceae archaeon]|nr:hypothetical protein [Nitrososphaeraceae archaeon]
TSHWPHSISGFIYFEFDNIFCKNNKEKRNSLNTIKIIYNNRKNPKHSQFQKCSDNKRIS